MDDVVSEYGQCEPAYVGFCNLSAAIYLTMDGVIANMENDNMVDMCS